jgi:hypothetical protein
MDNLIKETSKELGYDMRVVNQVIRHSFKFFRDLATNDDERSYMIHYFGKFIHKNIFKDINKSLPEPNIKLVIALKDNKYLHNITYMNNKFYDQKNKEITNVLAWKYKI